MESGKPSFTTIDGYIAQFSADVQKKLTELRAVINECAPGAVEKISYQMPAFTLNGNLVYFAAFKQHIGFYPTASGIANFQAELAGYKQSKGAVQFPIDKPIPFEIVRKIVAFRVQENLAGVKTKSK
jgi:uncharacterized protein YdhG (YjbR/CyaY superfamily)